MRIKKIDFNENKKKLMRMRKSISNERKKNNFNENKKIELFVSLKYYRALY